MNVDIVIWKTNFSRDCGFLLVKHRADPFVLRQAEMIPGSVRTSLRNEFKEYSGRVQFEVTAFSIRNNERRIAI